MKIEEFMNIHWKKIALLIFVILLFLFFLLKNTDATTYLSPGECQTLGNETLCAKEIAKSNFVCAPNFTLSCPSVSFTCPEIPSCPAHPNVSVTSNAYTGGAEFYKEYKDYVPHTFFGVLLLIVLIMFRKELKDYFKRNGKQNNNKQSTTQKQNNFGGKDGL